MPLRILLASALLLSLSSAARGAAPDRPDGAPADGSRQIALRVAAGDDDDPAAAGKAAATALKKQLGDLPVKAVLVVESYEGRERKAEALKGVCSVFPEALVFGGSTYGAYHQGGLAAGESIVVAAIAGKDVDVRIASVEAMGTAGLTLEKNAEELEKRLSAAGGKLAADLGKSDRDRLLIVIADAHSPKNGFLVKGVQSALGPAFPVTGGSVNKNAGQSFVYVRGKMLSDAVVGLMVGGDFKLAMAGRQAKENDQVISTAREGATEALAALRKQGARPAFVLAFDCAGRKGKLKTVADEQAAVRQAIGADVPLLGTYNAGEIGPADVADKTPGVLSSGVGWHVMFTAVGW